MIQIIATYEHTVFPEDGATCSDVSKAIPGDFKVHRCKTLNAAFDYTQADQSCTFSLIDDSLVNREYVLVATHRICKTTRILLLNLIN
jgi:hypothetical protein